MGFPAFFDCRYSLLLALFFHKPADDDHDDDQNHERPFEEVAACKEAGRFFPHA